jgi:sugar phosphate isomerase/epimerase
MPHADSPGLIAGLVSITFRALEPAAIMALAQRCGLRAIEWGADVHVPPGDLARARLVAQQMSGSGLLVSSYGSYYRAAREPESFADVLRAAVALGAPRIRVWAGSLDAEKASPEERLAVVKDLRRIVALAAREDVRLAVEFHGGTLTSNAGSAVALLDEVPDCDTYWQPRVGVSPEAALADLVALAPRLCHAHVFHWGADGARHALADGVDAWPRYLRVLSALKRPLHVQLEYVKGDQPEQLVADAATLCAWISGRERQAPPPFPATR